jgi:hydrogenase/urease accessory protein HupE
MNLFKYLRVQWDRAGAVVCAVAGIVALLIGYAGTSDTEYIAEQIPYVISGGLAAVVLFVAAGVLWLSADLRDEWRELAAQGDDLRAFLESEGTTQSGRQSARRDG